MPYTFSTTFGAGAVLAPCLATLCAEIAASPTYRVLTNLGEIGDQTHQTQGTDSDHNPFVVGPSGSKHPGKGYVRAIDLGGDQALLLQLRSALFALYRAHDTRLYPYGYGKGPDSLIFDWPPGTGYHVDTGDEGHLHISVGIRSPGDPSGWIAALDSTAPWGINQEDDMPLTDNDVSKIAKAVRDVMIPSPNPKGAPASLGDRITAIQTNARIAATRNVSGEATVDVDALAADLKDSLGAAVADELAKRLTS